MRLKDKIKLSEANRNTLTLAIGTSISQAIPLAVSPILTRLYTPKDFGVFALYFSIVSILTIITTGRYELAITLPKKDTDAINIVALTVLSSFIISAILFIIAFVFHDFWLRLLGNPEISIWLYLIPCSTFLTGTYQAFYYWFNRKKNYKQISVNRISQNTITAGTSLFLGIYKLLKGGLIIGRFLGQLITTILFLLVVTKKEKQEIKQIRLKAIKRMAKQYIDFPKFMILGHGLNRFSKEVPIIVFSSIGLTTSGFYSLVRLVIGAPSGILANAIGDDFRQRASEMYANKLGCRELFVSTFKKLFSIAIIPFIIFYFIAPQLFAFIFGEEWKLAGEYAQILTPMFFLQFIIVPLSSMFMIAGKQKIDLYWQVILVSLLLLSIYIGKYVYADVDVILILISISYSVAYMINFILAYSFSKEK